MQLISLIDETEMWQMRAFITFTTTQKVSHCQQKQDSRDWQTCAWCSGLEPGSWRGMPGSHTSHDHTEDLSCCNDCHCTVSSTSPTSCHHHRPTTP